MAGAEPNEPRARDGIGSTRSSFRSAAVYTFGFAIQRAIGVLMLPLYTRAVTPAEYGALGVLLAAAAAAVILFSLGLDIAIFRRYFQLADSPAEQRAFVDSAWRFLVVFPLVGALLVSGIAWPLVDGQRYVDGIDVLIMLLGAALSVAATTLPMSILRAEQALRKYLILTAVTTLGTPFFTGLFVVVLDEGVRGWLLAMLIANGLAMLAAMRVMPWHHGTRFDRRSIREALRFSLPLLPQSFSHWALQLADRTVIAGLVTSASVGLYSLAANLASPILTVVVAVHQGLMPVYAKAGVRRGYDDALRETVVRHIAAVASITLAGCLVGPPMLDVIAPSSYYGASELVPWIMLGYGFLGLYYIPMNGATLMEGRGGFSWVATAFSATLNIGLILAFVPGHGIKAAAIASAVGYLALLAGSIVYARAGARPIPYDWPRIASVLLLAAGVFAAAQLVAPADAALRLAVALGWCVVFAAAVLSLRLVPAGP